MSSNTQVMDMTRGKIFKKMIVFTIPLILTGIIQFLFNAADLVVAGRFAGKIALAAVGSTGSLINLIINVAIGLSVGAGVVVSMYIGARDAEKVKKTIGTSITTAIFCGIICMCIGCIAAKKILTLMETPKDILDQAILYFRIYFLGAPAMIVYNFAASILRAAGETKKPLFYLAVTGVLNVFLNLLFVIKFKMGAAGVGTATTISQYLAMLLVMRKLIITDEIYKFYFSEMKIDINIFKKILLIGIPTGLQGIVFSMSNVIIQSSINYFGSEVVAGNSAAQNIEGVVYIAMNSVSNACITFVGQNYGAKNYRRINKIFVDSLLFVSALGIICGLMVFTFSHHLIQLYCPDSEAAIGYGITRLKYIILPYFLCGAMEVASGVLRGTNHSVIPMITSVLGACVFRIIWIYTVFQSVKTLNSIYISYPISWLLTLLAHVIMYLIVKKSIREKCQSSATVI